MGVIIKKIFKLIIFLTFKNDTKDKIIRIIKAPFLFPPPFPRIPNINLEM